jgi:hypothetical protein
LIVVDDGPQQAQDELQVAAVDVVGFNVDQPVKETGWLKLGRNRLVLDQLNEHLVNHILQALVVHELETFHQVLELLDGKLGCLDVLDGLAA